MPSTPNRAWPSAPLSPDPSGWGTPRADTPDPEVQQGRRNATSSGVQLLDAEGGISDKVRLNFVLVPSYGPLTQAGSRMSVSPMPRAYLREICRSYPTFTAINGRKRTLHTADVFARRYDPFSYR